MKYLLEIREEDIGIKKVNKVDAYRLRRTARAILFNDKNEISYQFVSKLNFHTLPGGGIEEGETIEQGLRREIREEVGCEIIIEKPIGVVVEYKDEKKLLQISYCFIARVSGKIGEPLYDKKEIEAGTKSCWGKLEDVLMLIENDNTDDYTGKFVKLRELAFIKQI